MGCTKNIIHRLINTKLLEADAVLEYEAVNSKSKEQQKSFRFIFESDYHYPFGHLLCYIQKLGHTALCFHRYKYL